MPWKRRVTRRRSSRHHGDGESSSSSSDVRVPEEEVATEAEEVVDEQIDRTPQRWSKLAALLPILVCFFGTGRNPWVMGMAAIAVGLLLVLAPPKNPIPVALLAVMGLILGLGLISIIPVPVIPLPSWRQTLQEDFQISLAHSWSAQPLVTLELWCWQLMLMLWFCWGVSHWQTATDRAPTLRWVALSVSLLAVLVIVFQLLRWEPAWWDFRNMGDIGPFANRNHTASLMAVNAVLCLACCYDLLRRRKRAWLLYGLAMLPCFAVVMMVKSRAGLVLFFLGVNVWLIMASVRKRSVARVAIMGSLMLGLIAGTVLGGQAVLKRFENTSGSVVEKLSNDSRFDLYQDAFAFVGRYPVLGVGAGNFLPVFNQFTELGEGFRRFRHPESDFFWFSCEQGWPATLALLLGVVFVISWMGPWKLGKKSLQRRDRRLRLAASLAVLMILLHAVFDVPLHDLPLALMVAMLASISLYHGHLQAARTVVLPRLFQGLGVLIIIAGGLWIGTGLGMTSLMGQSASERDLALVTSLLAKDDARGAYLAADRATRSAPLDWLAWYRRAETGLAIGRSQSEAMQDFSRARYIDPHLAIHAMEEARVWLKYNPSMAIPVWREALQRESTEAHLRYREMLQAMEVFPELKPQIRSLAKDARLLLTYLAYVYGKDFNDGLDEMLARHHSLDGLSSPERAYFFDLWQQRGDRDKLVAALQANEEWQKDGWRFLAAELARLGRHREAYEMAVSKATLKINLPIEIPREETDLLKEFRFAPSDPKRGFDLVIKQRSLKHYDQALETLRIMEAQENHSPHVYYELAKTYGAKGDYKSAWEQMQRYLQP